MVTVLSPLLGSSLIICRLFSPCNIFVKIVQLPGKCVSVTVPGSPCTELSCWSLVREGQSHSLFPEVVSYPGREQPDQEERQGPTGHQAGRMS